MDDLIRLFGGAFGLVILVFLLFLVIASILLPLFVWGIYNQTVKQTKLIQAAMNDASPLHQTKLLTEIRNALQSMQAVGIEDTGQDEQEPLTPPPIRNPSSVPPNRERFRQ